MINTNLRSSNHIYKHICIFLIIISVFFLSNEISFYPSADDIIFKYINDNYYSLFVANFVNGRYIPGLFFLINMNFLDDFAVNNLLFLYLFSIILFSYIFLYNINIQFFCFSYCSFLFVIFLFPYGFSYYTIKLNYINMSLAFFFVSIAITLINRIQSRFSLFLSSIFLIFVFMSNQSTSIFFIVFLFSKFLFNNHSQKECLHVLINGLLMFIFSFVCYGLIYTALSDYSISLVDQSDRDLLTAMFSKTRGALVDPGIFYQKALVYLVTVIWTFVGNEAAISQFLKLVILLIIVTPILLWAKSLTKWNAPPPAIVKAKGLCLIAMAGLCASPIHLFLELDHIPSRVLMHASAVIGCFLLFGLHITATPMKGLVGAGHVAVVTLLGYNAVALFFDHAEIWKRDKNLAGEIWNSIQSLDNGGTQRTLAVVGRLPPGSTHMSGIRRQHAINRSKFYSSRPVVPMLSDTAGTKLLLANRSQQNLAEAFCERKSPIKNLYEIAQGDDFLILCLEDIDYRWDRFWPDEKSPAGAGLEGSDRAKGRDQNLR